MIPRDARELHAADGAAATVVEQIVNDALRDAVFELRVVEALPQLRIATCKRPGWNEDVEARRARGVRILIDHHVRAGSTRRIDHVPVSYFLLSLSSFCCVLFSV